MPRLPLDLSWPHYYPNCLRVVYHFVGRGGPGKAMGPEIIIRMLKGAWIDWFLRSGSLK